MELKLLHFTLYGEVVYSDSATPVFLTIVQIDSVDRKRFYSDFSLGIDEGEEVAPSNTFFALLRLPFGCSCYRHSIRTKILLKILFNVFKQAVVLFRKRIELKFVDRN